MTELNPKTRNKLTVPENRLAGSDSCQNCGTELQGPYCHYCGQPDKNFFRFFPALLREMMGDLLDYDSRLTRTMKPLLFQPGKIATDYMQGRRFRYTSPVRLYLFSSIIFFVLASFITNLSISEAVSESAIGHAKTVTTESIPPSSETKVQTDAEDKEHNWAEPIFKIDLESDASGASEDIDLPFLPQSLNSWINAELAKSEIKSAAIEEDPSLITNKIFDLLPMTIFALLPVFALLLKAFYVFTKRYYTEHLIFALYNHSFLFVLAIIILLFTTGMGAAVANGWISEAGWLFTISGWLTVLLWIWMGIYLWLALKRYYQQGWLMTSVKYLGIGFLYIVVLSLVTTLIAVISFLLL